MVDVILSEAKDDTLRRQPLNGPRRFFAPVANSVVQTVGPALPEFDLVRHNAETAPVRRERNINVRETLGDRLYAVFEISAVRDDRALMGRSRADAAADWSRSEIRLRLLGAHA